MSLQQSPSSPQVSRFLIIVASLLAVFGVFAAVVYADYLYSESLGQTPAVSPSPTIRTHPGGPIEFNGYPETLKPVIYIYPSVTEKVTVKLDYKGRLTTTYPAIDPVSERWSVTAHPDGSLINDKDGKEYSYLYWEGDNNNYAFDEKEGFVVKGSDTAAFLQDKLAALGLTPKEYNEFIIYWMPKMQANPYNFIRFLGTEYTDHAVLDITPKPDSVLRVFMAYKPLSEPVIVKEQKLPPFSRHGFTVVEWGGTEMGR